MFQLTDRLDHYHEPTGVLTLPFGTRQKSRFRATLDDGREVGVVMPRGLILRGGDLLTGEAGDVVIVQAAPEAVSTAFQRDPRLLARGAYHLGNRHVPLQLGDSWVRYHADHVLDELATALELTVFHESAPFEPEGGAFDEKAPELANVHRGAAGHDHGHHHHHG